MSTTLLQRQNYFPPVDGKGAPQSRNFVDIVSFSHVYRKLTPIGVFPRSFFNRVASIGCENKKQYLCTLNANLMHIPLQN
jgi:hypothetical protein